MIVSRASVKQDDIPLGEQTVSQVSQHTLAYLSSLIAQSLSASCSFFCGQQYDTILTSTNETCVDFSLRKLTYMYICVLHILVYRYKHVTCYQSGPFCCFLADKP